MWMDEKIINTIIISNINFSSIFVFFSNKNTHTKPTKQSKSKIILFQIYFFIKVNWKYSDTW